jgi:hypothetical protein
MHVETNHIVEKYHVRICTRDPTHMCSHVCTCQNEKCAAHFVVCSQQI